MGATSTSTSPTNWSNNDASYVVSPFPGASSPFPQGDTGSIRAFLNTDLAMDPAQPLSAELLARKKEINVTRPLGGIHDARSYMPMFFERIRLVFSLAEPLEQIIGLKTQLAHRLGHILKSDDRTWI